VLEPLSQHPVARALTNRSMSIGASPPFVGHNRQIELGQTVHHSTADTRNVDDRPHPVVLVRLSVDVRVTLRFRKPTLLRALAPCIISEPPRADRSGESVSWHAFCAVRSSRTLGLWHMTRPVRCPMTGACSGRAKRLCGCGLSSLPARRARPGAHIRRHASLVGPLVFSWC
jgi:hypothetical protein